MEGPVTMSIAEARDKLTSLPAQLGESIDDGVVMVTRRNRPVLAIMPWELYDSIIETLEVLGDPELMKQLRQSINEAVAGEAIPWEQVKKRLERESGGSS